MSSDIAQKARIQHQLTRIARVRCVLMTTTADYTDAVQADRQLPAVRTGLLRAYLRCNTYVPLPRHA